MSRPAERQEARKYSGRRAGLGGSKKAALDGRSHLTPMSKFVLFVETVKHGPTRNTLTHCLYLTIPAKTGQ
jgi:hypothetical protein